ncbi:hypothetical protein JMX53_12745 [Cutibacterium avidum]|jgi:hypothetical protein|uniref:hypothetical protein n=1 Tax=Cutibacterium avidum TaxID=33010 RepID=UPI00192AA97E|nr:hypothetical protein [Cutibacterium avidum]MDU7718812.1 hypothetical protein [Cutibacterium avidum]MDU7935137.1 hypothetical protein [Pseudomonas aeruginosa]QQY15038.1 hypothetical protein JMX53_12745 [Cutibacterium avidum]DAI62781.1 MAG TPA: SOS-response transcriptional repressor [Caudoviricetes sp.]
MSNPQEQLAAEARAAIARAGLQKKDVAASLRIETRTLRNKLSGESPLSVDEIGIIAHLTGANPGDMINAAYGINGEQVAA